MPLRHHLEVLLYDVKTDLVANNNIYTMTTLPRLMPRISVEALVFG